jgi:hypothetical protein
MCICCKFQGKLPCALARVSNSLVSVYSGVGLHTIIRDYGVHDVTLCH